MPIQQWLYYDALECLPDDHDNILTEDTCKPVSDCVSIFACLLFFIVTYYIEICTSYLM